MPNELRPFRPGVEILPRPETVVQETDSFADLLDLYREPDDILDELGELTEELFDLYRQERDLQNQKARAAQTMRETRDYQWQPEVAKRYESASESWDRADEGLEELRQKITELEGEIDVLLSRLSTSFVALDESDWRPADPRQQEEQVKDARASLVGAE